MVVTDLDGLGGPDLVGMSATNAVAALNNGLGGFGGQQTIAMGSVTLGALQVADLNGDGRNDLVAISRSRALVSRLKSRLGARSRPESELE